MARYRMEDDKIVDTANAQQRWREETRWNGNNHVSVHTGSQWDHQTLYRSAKGAYYIEHESQWQGSTPHAEWVSREVAAKWLILNEDSLPEDLADLEGEVVE